MGLTARVPPGRSGRLWLRRRIDTASSGRDQLDRKLRILVPERQRLQILNERSQQEWEAACDEARTWLLRASILGGQDALRGAVAPQFATVAISWTTAMGLDYPVDVQLTGRAPDAPVAPGNAAIGPTAAAFRAALVCGVRLAAAQEALRRVDAEIAVTRQRLRALDRRWLPSLTDALDRLELALDQAEQEDGIRLRRAGSGTRWTS
jgi:V/A-type H+-transporting ATPase subunit D